MRYVEDAYFVLNYMKNHVCVYMPKCETTSILSKCSFGESWLSANILAMTLGGQTCLTYVYNHKKINYITYLLAIIWSWVRYFRRKLLTSIFML